jgi:DNA modification methylase
VLWVASGTGNYNPAVEGLIYRLWQGGYKVLRPCIWHKNPLPTGQGWFSNSWEYVVAVTNTWPLPYWNPEAVGQPIKYAYHGAIRHRKRDGTRVVRRNPMRTNYAVRKRPGNVFYVPVGGGHMGHPLACENEAPYPEALVEPFIKALCPPGGTVLDPFCGSGTTLAVAGRLGRDAIGVDVRESQIELSKRRLEL